MVRRKDGEFLNILIEQNMLTVSKTLRGRSVWEIKRSRDFRAIRKTSPLVHGRSFL
jgi:hypothetical protein